MVTPIPKSTFEDPCMPLNYRGITLLSCTSKVYTKVLNKRIITYVEEGNILVEEHSGFRAHRSCLHNLFSLTSIIRNENSAGKHVYAAVLDMQKAFDWVDRDLLKYKLLSIGINGKIFNAIDQLYRKTVSCVKLNQFKTNWFEVNSGVRQGDSLSPTLFNIYINDLVNDLNSMNLGVDINGRRVCCLLYADDIVIFL